MVVAACVNKSTPSFEVIKLAQAIKTLKIQTKMPYCSPSAKPFIGLKRPLGSQLDHCHHDAFHIPTVLGISHLATAGIGQALHLPSSNWVSKFRAKNGTPPSLERRRGDFAPSVLIISRRGSEAPKRERARRDGISSARCVVRSGAKEEIRLFRCIPEKEAGLALLVARYSLKAVKPGRKASEFR